jgi:hypothetical protein
VSDERPYTPPRLVRLSPDDPRAVRLRAELAALDRLTVEFDEGLGPVVRPKNVAGERS